MKRKVVEIIYKSNIYDVLFDYKVKLECGHFQWFWKYKGDLMGSMQSCSKCGTPNKLEILK